tara:strand:+ start:307 stop:1878 length:1572 start_codon:yes stop_codon:yes gene_type:complete
MTRTKTRALANWPNNGVSVLDYGAVGDGVTDDTAAIQAAIDYAATVVVSNLAAAGADLDIVTAAVFIPAGTYKVTSLVLKNGVSLKGASQSTSYIKSASSTVFSSDPAQNSFSWCNHSDFTVDGLGTANIGFQIDKHYRNNSFTNITVMNFQGAAIQFTNSWTNVLRDCSGFNNEHHVDLNTGTGGIHFIGGRFDVAQDDSIICSSNTAELHMLQTAVQTGKGAAIYSTTALTVDLTECFFEGLCIDRADRYYVQVTGSNTSTATVSIKQCVFNDLGQTQRAGLGPVFVADFPVLDFEDGWLRNQTKSVPVTSNVSISRITLNSSNSLDFTSWDRNSLQYLQASRKDRPYQVYGMDMEGNVGSWAPTLRAAANFGSPDIGVAIGTGDQIPAIQAYGAGYKLSLNPWTGDITLGNTPYMSITSGTNTLKGTFAHVAKLSTSNITGAKYQSYYGVDCTAGGRSVNLSAINPTSGQVIVVGKRDSTTNPLTISGATINGASSYVLNQSYQHVQLIWGVSSWYVLGA